MSYGIGRRMTDGCVLFQRISRLRDRLLCYLLRIVSYGLRERGVGVNKREQ